ncbi:hypothetical protein AT246_02270 [Bartonella henselae]|uniref:hypothetical protein n=1 Tax=Bartonella henselae TaxID=38323 RepID=UPI000964C8E2|nr:hypothetical protein [Bartonella henselae]MDM9997009.1 hypothetical protein [Bartonella henselae]OLL50501.1 hypothetical protein AT247_06220 [Bartonella henselae]OLL51346.1 hypothetical protein AT243_07255 [Bartonella henselae]OLL51626.1 hypothetical protein AT241_05190 [Bartonella henselae]OLL55490.1 hypothetical protein AT240_06705 [Bartonella henselae]
MYVFKYLFLKKTKQPVPKIHKKFVATVLDHALWVVGGAEYFYNLYEYPDGSREYEEFDGGQYYNLPENVYYSTTAEVKAGLYEGNLPKSVLNYEPLIDELNRKIKKLSGAA